jgi:hypothetical protein
MFSSGSVGAMKVRNTDVSYRAAVVVGCADSITDAAVLEILLTTTLVGSEAKLLLD